jgi:hypothetical protein
MGKNWNVFWKTFIVVAITFIAFFVALYIKDKYFSDMGLDIVLSTLFFAFVGVSATFVVVSNYAQVAEVKKEIPRIEDIKKEISTTGSDTTIDLLLLISMMHDKHSQREDISEANGLLFATLALMYAREDSSGDRVNICCNSLLETYENTEHSLTQNVIDSLQKALHRTSFCVKKKDRLQKFIQKLYENPLIV